jgi:hypothetical protein
LPHKERSEQLLLSLGRLAASPLHGGGKGGGRSRDGGVARGGDESGGSSGGKERDLRSQVGTDPEGIRRLTGTQPDFCSTQ